MLAPPAGVCFLFLVPHPLPAEGGKVAILFLARNKEERSFFVQKLGVNYKVRLIVVASFLSCWMKDKSGFCSFWNLLPIVF